MIIVVDYGLGNLGSIANMLKKIGASFTIASDSDSIMNADKILLPGVGAFDAAMEKIDETGLREVLTKKAKVDKVPFLGICLGMQLIAEKSDEGALNGLGFIEGECKRFQFEDNKLKIPHMGWNTIELMKESELTAGMNNEEQRFYFVHSYYVQCVHQEDIVATTNYGGKFASIIQKRNVFGAQFHPEKSHRFGMNLLSNFARL